MVFFIWLLVIFLWPNTLNAEEIEIQPELQNVRLEFSNILADGSFEVVISGDINTSSNMYIDIWSAEDKVDDIVTFEVSIDSTGKYFVRDSVQNHNNYQGAYYANIYLYDETGEKNVVSSTECYVEVPVLASSYSDMSINVMDINGEKGLFKVIVNGQSDDQNLKIAVWSTKDGQDDLKWYSLDEVAIGNYEKIIDIRNHGYTQGEYNIHLYCEDKKGDSFYIGSANASLALPIKVEMIENNWKYEVSVGGEILEEAYSKIRFAVWSSKGGMDDVVWYVADKKDADLFSGTVYLENHKSLGEFYVHFYGQNKDCREVFLGGETSLTELPKVHEIRTNLINKKNGTFQVNITNIENATLIKKIKVAVWSDENGQDDLKWYKAKEENNNIYNTEINIRDHGACMGRYNVHVYLVDVTNDEYYVGATFQQFDIDAGNLLFEQHNSDYQMLLQDVVIPGGVKNIYFLTWSDINGQDDLIWYDGIKTNSGYLGDAIISKHKGLGKYHTHVYAKLYNNQMVYLTGGEFETGSPEVNKIDVDLEMKEQGKFRVKLSGIKNEELIKKIEVPIWSDKKQKDIVWYTAQKDEEENYIVNVDIKNHNYNCIIYNIHVYLTDITGQRRYDR